MDTRPSHLSSEVFVMFIGRGAFHLLENHTAMTANSNRSYLAAVLYLVDVPRWPWELEGVEAGQNCCWCCLDGWCSMVSSRWKWIRVYARSNWRVARIQMCEDSFSLYIFASIGFDKCEIRETIDLFFFPLLHIWQKLNQVGFSSKEFFEKRENSSVEDAGNDLRFVSVGHDDFDCLFHHDNPVERRSIHSDRKSSLSLWWEWKSDCNKKEFHWASIRSVSNPLLTVH